MNPCKCGYLGDPRHKCRCSPRQIQDYRARLSGPLLDRIDIHVEASALPVDELRSKGEGEPSAEIRKRVAAARRIQAERFAGSRRPSKINASMDAADIRKYCALDDEQASILSAAMEELNLSARGVGQNTESLAHNRRPRLVRKNPNPPPFRGNQLPLPRQNRMTTPAEKFFKLRDRKTTLPREIAAGFTTFATMSYILAVNPAILGLAGMDKAALVTVTALATAFGCVVMALLTNMPIAVAPAMGLEHVFCGSRLRWNGNGTGARPSRSCSTTGFSSC